MDKTILMSIRVVLISALAAAAIFAGILAARSHDHSNHAYDDWYKSLTSPGGGPCCDGPEVDALKVGDPDWRIGSAGYQVRLDGAWIDVPDDRVVKQRNVVGQAIVWPFYRDGKATIRCFLPGSAA